MKPYDQLKKMKEIGFFEDLKKFGFIKEHQQGLEKLLAKYEEHPENIKKPDVTIVDTSYWYWGSRGCGSCPPGRPCT